MKGLYGGHTAMGKRFQRLSLMLGLSAIAMTATGCGLSGTSPPPSLPLDQYAGWVRLNCGVLPNGPLTDCRIVEEHPEGAGFGETALLAASRSRVTPETAERTAGGTRIEYTARFRRGDDSEPASPTRPDPQR